MLFNLFKFIVKIKIYCDTTECLNILLSQPHEYKFALSLFSQTSPLANSECLLSSYTNFKLEKSTILKIQTLLESPHKAKDWVLKKK